MLMYYAGIGSRRTPGDILATMKRLASRLSSLTYILRSGGAKGADTAFEEGATEKAIFRASHATEDAMELASTLHPAWHLCDSYARQLHGRNCMIILGEKLDTPVEFVVCWQDPLVERGGTRLGMRLAESRGISVYNLAVPGHYKQLLDERYL